MGSLVLHRTGTEGRALTRDAWRRGKNAAWLPEVYWEELLVRPIEEVRDMLGLGAPPVYSPVYPEDIGIAA